MKINKPTILILGHARFGKDSAAEYFRDNFGMTFQSSSMAAAEIFIFDELKDKYEYTTLEECFEEQTSTPHPEHYYCKHRERLAVQREGGWETYTNVAPENVAELLSSCA